MADPPITVRSVVVCVCVCVCACVRGCVCTGVCVRARICKGVCVGKGLNERFAQQIVVSPTHTRKRRGISDTEFGHPSAHVIRSLTPGGMRKGIEKKKKKWRFRCKEAEGLGRGQRQMSLTKCCLTNLRSKCARGKDCSVSFTHPPTPQSFHDSGGGGGGIRCMPLRAVFAQWLIVVWGVGFQWDCWLVLLVACDIAGLVNVGCQWHCWLVYIGCLWHCRCGNGWLPVTLLAGLYWLPVTLQVW